MLEKSINSVTFVYALDEAHAGLIIRKQQQSKRSKPLHRIGQALLPPTAGIINQPDL